VGCGLTNPIPSRAIGWGGGGFACADTELGRLIGGSITRLTPTLMLKISRRYSYSQKLFSKRPQDVDRVFTH